MARPFVLEIAESIEFLERSLKQAKSGARKERLQMLWWIKNWANPLSPRDQPSPQPQSGYPYSLASSLPSGRLSCFAGGKDSNSHFRK
ncbi:MAG: hypothetical protein HC886_05260 [Leptolyngbyaceae cyanobacterium SM1_1_3]|nr:hypothetical protein [Leptolyngbyaceae cyanobacterium SM1_1_3]